MHHRLAASGNPTKPHYEFVKLKALFGALILSSLVLASSAKADGTKVPCDGFALGFDAPNTSQTCYTATISQGRYSADRKEIVADGSDYLLRVVYDVAAHNVYFPQSSTQDNFVSMFGQTKTSDWGAQSSIGGYDIATFVLLGGSQSVHCFAFDKYAGVPHGELEGSIGYLRRAIGFYCGLAMSDAGKRDSTIATALRGLRVPSN